ncbi:unnamed protein product [Allacma fusca]|uniref:AIP/AIPL N-terminal FKBP-type PPIase domain-containing protein n=1 Tax=Allacma fusca TaxID=39272 RepID=A0A8J2KXM6_9HEXA|nr:unnamed protein product [Allacma fusca]
MRERLYFWTYQLEEIQGIPGSWCSLILKIRIQVVIWLKDDSVENDGKSSDRPASVTTKVIFHFETRVKDSEDVIDNTKNMKNPMELLLGRQFKLEVWESMLKTMAVGEVAKFEVPKVYVISYPIVSRALRDSQRPKDHKVEHHCCGMMNQGCGYQDLDKLLETPKDLEFIFEIVEVMNAGEYEKEAWQMTGEEKLASVPSLKEEGNVLFQKQDYKGAAAKYHEAIARIEQLALREKPGGPESMELDVLKVPLLLNYALCLMKMEDYYGAMEHFSTVLKIDPSNVKGLFRRAKCHAFVGNTNEASIDFTRAVELDSSLKTSVTEEMKKLSLQDKAHDENTKKLFQKMFNA